MPTPNIKYLDNLKVLFQTNAARQLTYMVGIAISVALGIVLFLTIQEPIYRPLDYPVSPQNIGSVADILEKNNINYKINDRDGVIYVAAQDAQRARLKLSVAGIPKDDGFNFSFLNEQSGLANSQFIENARYLRALENDLAKTITAIEGVSAARVHIAMPQNNTFADETGKTTASVVLSVSPAFLTDKEKIRAIIQILAGSVPGLDPKNVSITDQYGHYLSAGLDQNALHSAEQLAYQNTVQNYYEKRINAILTPMLGENKANVQVHADLDFTLQEEAQEEYDPDKKALRSEQTISDQSGSAGASGAPGSLSNSPPAGESDKGSGSSSSSQRSQSTKNYEVTKVVNYKKSGYGKVKALSVAVVVDNEVVTDPKTKKTTTKPLDQDKINKITSLVKATIGFDADRGDQVTVINSGFNIIQQDMTHSDEHLWDHVWFWDAFKKITGIVLGFAMLFIIYRRLTGDVKPIRAPKVKPLTAAAVGGASVSLQTSSIASGSAGTDTSTSVSDEASIIDPEAQQTKEVRMNKLKTLAASEPSRVALIIKNWVGK